MKSILLASIVTLPLLFSACETRVVERRPLRPRRAAVVVAPRPFYGDTVNIRYYNDTRGRYYFRGGRRVYVNATVY